MDKKDADRSLKGLVYATTKLVTSLAVYSAGTTTFAWGCMHERWRFVLLGVGLQILSSLFARNDLRNSWEKRLRYVEKRLRISPGECFADDYKESA